MLYNMDMNKKIAQYELDFIGGIPKVSRFYNVDNSKSIDIVKCSKSKFLNNDVIATIGLSSFDSGFVVEDLSLRIELIAISDKDDEIWENILATTAFQVMDTQEGYYGAIIENVISEYSENTQMKHLLLLTPIYWEESVPMKYEDKLVAWLMLVPISESEKEFIDENGIEEFEKLLERENVDIPDLSRKSII